MLFDPFTMIAQLINFVVLVVALRHFLYKPVIDAMDERENKIAQRLTDADEREHEAEAAAESYRRRQVEIDDRRDELLENAGHDAAERRTELIEQAREDVEDRRNRWLQGLRREREDLDRELQRRVGAEVLVVGRRALVALADADIERRALDKALDHLEADEPARSALFGTPEDPDRPATVTVRLGFPDQVDRPHLIARLRELGLGEQQAVEFEHSPDAILGVEMRSDTTSIEWNLGDYFDRLGIIVDQLIGEGGGDVSLDDRRADAH